jgi:hypothetical protein
MLLSNDFVKAEHKYRMETIRDQHKPASGKFATTAGAVVVAALLTAALAACGVPQEGDTGAAVGSRVFQDQAPSWQPNERLLRDFLRSYHSSSQVVVPAVEFGGMAAPTWEPNYGRLETLLGANPTFGPR